MRRVLDDSPILCVSEWVHFALANDKVRTVLLVIFGAGEGFLSKAYVFKSFEQGEYVRKCR